MNEKVQAGAMLVELIDRCTCGENLADLTLALETRWSPECLSLLLEDDNGEVVAAALTGLQLIGEPASCEALAKVLHHHEFRFVQGAEDALWAIWFRAAGPVAQSVLVRITHAIDSCESDDTVAMLTELIRAFPDYAEAYHQRSQTHYLAGRFDASLKDARRACELAPMHFAAWANQAHCLAAKGRFADALAMYRRVLQVHPRMAGIRESMNQLRRRIAAHELSWT